MKQRFKVGDRVVGTDKGEEPVPGVVLRISGSPRVSLNALYEVRADDPEHEKRSANRLGTLFFYDSELEGVE